MEAEKLFVFESKSAEKAHKAWVKALEIIGGPSAASKLTGINQSQLSIITHGVKIKKPSLSKNKERRQGYPTLEQAIKISLLTNGKITAEQLLPHYDFKHLYKYVKMRGK